MNRLEKRVEKLEEAFYSLPEDAEQNERLMRQIREARERVGLASPDEEQDTEPLFLPGECPCLPNGKVDIAAILQRARERAMARAMAQKQAEEGE